MFPSTLSFLLLPSAYSSSWDAQGLVGSAGAAGWQRMVAQCPWVAGDSVGRLDQRRCALPPCSPSGIIHPNGVIFLLQEGTAAGGTQGFSRGTSWAASTSQGASKPWLTPRLCHPALCLCISFHDLHFPHQISTVRHPPGAMGVLVWP